MYGDNVYFTRIYYKRYHDWLLQTLPTAQYIYQPHGLQSSSSSWKTPPNTSGWESVSCSSMGSVVFSPSILLLRLLTSLSLFNVANLLFISRECASIILKTVVLLWLLLLLLAVTSSLGVPWGDGVPEDVGVILFLMFHVGFLTGHDIAIYFLFVFCKDAIE